MDQSTAVEILNLDDNTVQLRMSQGTMNVGLHQLAADERYEVDTPSAVVSLLRAGIYRVDVSPDATSVQVTVRSGISEIATSTYDFLVYAGQAAVILRSENTLSYDIRPPAASDDFDQWAMARERQEQIALQEAQYVSSGMRGPDSVRDVAGRAGLRPGVGPRCGGRGGFRPPLGPGVGFTVGVGLG